MLHPAPGVDEASFALPLVTGANVWPSLCRPRSQALPDSVLESWNVSEICRLRRVVRRRPLRIYVYDSLPHKFSPARYDNFTLGGHNFGNITRWCLPTYYSLELRLHRLLLRSKLRTLDRKAADLFYVPIPSACLFHRVDETLGRARSVALVRGHMRSAWRYLWRASSALRRSGGSDHLWVFSHDHGVGAPYVPWPIAANVSSITAEAHPKFAAGSPQERRQIIVPPTLFCGPLLARLFRRSSGPPTIGRRRIEAFFSGTARNGHFRQAFARWADERMRARAPGLLVGPPPPRGPAERAIEWIRTKLPPWLPLPALHGHLQFGDYMGEATFCLAPRGFASWSARMYEALFAACVPVVLSDGWSPPFRRLLQWDRLVVRVAEGHLGELEGAMRRVPTATVRAMQERLPYTRLPLCADGLGEEQTAAPGRPKAAAAGAGTHHPFAQWLLLELHAVHQRRGR